MNDRLRDELRRAAEDFEPDRTVIANRVAARRAADRRRQRTRPRAAGAGVAVVLAFSVVAVRAGAGEGEAPPDTVAAPPSAAAPAESRPATSKPAVTRPAGSGAPESEVAGTSAATPPAKTFLSAAGVVAGNSVATWTQNTVTVKTTKAVTDFRLTVEVAATPGVDEAGKYASAPNGDLTISVRLDGGVLVYTYALKEGVKLRPGTYEFGAQFNHRGGRDGGGDRFAVSAKAGGAESEQDGLFRAR